MNKKIKILGMKLAFILALAMMMTFFAELSVFAEIGDSKVKNELAYGTPSFIKGLDGRLWTQEEWNRLPKTVRNAQCYGYRTEQNGMAATIWVTYNKQGVSEQEQFIMERAISIMDFVRYYPKLYDSIVKPETQVFTVHSYPRHDLAAVLRVAANTYKLVRFRMEPDHLNLPRTTKINIHSQIKSFEISAVSAREVKGRVVALNEDEDSQDSFEPIVYDGAWQSCANFFRPELYFSEKLISREDTNMIVIHHTAIDNMSTSEIHQLHLQNGWAGIGYHKVILPDGTIENGRPEEMIGAHAQGSNKRSIGISLVGDFNVHTPTPAQMAALLNVTAELAGEYHVSWQNIVPHRAVCDTDCPGKLFPWEQFKLELREKMQRDGV